MDITRRQITKIAREVSRFTVRAVREEGIGAGELDVVHTVRKNPGITPTGVREKLGVDKGALARQIDSLESKGYLIRRENPSDGRSYMLFPTEKAETLKHSKTHVEAVFYEWLLEEFTNEEAQTFAGMLERLYVRSKAESRAGFPNVNARLQREE